ncbi:TerB family tellurite resistance protein [Hymenobacter nivis]|uniref:TerB family tellurite resistance protein n=1 Tax=Hymenobacter nivis TaxID=1850093 RepID=A0A2Z3GP10_9BACT|nr:TerB family tellurite resistance protein [Hymenobacter nivis]AWM32695.1 TerB family tellurite resistance protein [Hymenobacter nivis]
MFGFFENEQAKKIKGHLCNLAALAKADGHIDEREMNFIITVGKKNGMGATEVRKIVAGNTNCLSDLPNTDSERFDQIYDLVDMMLSDGIVDENEMDFCIMMAEKLGFRNAIVGVLVRKISQGVKDGLPEDRIKEESLSFLNYNDLPAR